MNPSVFSGCMPAVMTPCRPDRTPDFDTMVEHAVGLIAAGMSAVVYCGSMGDWPLLTDAQRMEGVERLIKAGVPVIAGTGAINTQSAVRLAAHAQEAGARGLMVIPRVLSRGPSPVAQRAHFEAILAAAPNLPAVIYNSPYYGFATRADLFFALRAKYPNLVGFKEFGGADDIRYAAEFIASSGDIALMVGVDTEVVHGYVTCGARGTITGIGNILAREILLLVSLCEAAARGDVQARRDAKELEDALAVLSSFDEGSDLVLYYKHMMVLRGHAAYTLHFNETDRLTDSQQAYVEAQLALFDTWFAAWTAGRKS